MLSTGPGYGDTVIGPKFSPDMRWFATASSDGIRLLDLRKNAPGVDRPILPKGGSYFLNLEFSPDSRWLLVSRYDEGRLVLVNLRDPEQVIIRDLHGHRSPVDEALFVPGGRWLVTSDNAGSVRLWDLNADTSRIGRGTLPGEAHSYSKPVANADGTRLFLAGGERGDSHIYFLDKETPSDDPRVLKTPRTTYSDVAFSSDGRWLATSHRDSEIGNPKPDRNDEGYDVYLWRMESLPTEGAIPWSCPVTHPASPGSNSARTTDGLPPRTPGKPSMTRPAPRSTSGTSDSHTRSPHPNPLRVHRDSVWLVTFSPSGRWLVTASDDDDDARLWDLHSERPFNHPHVLGGQKHSGNHGWGVAFGPGEHWMLTWTNDSNTRVWDLKSPRPELSAVTLTGHEETVNVSAISRSGFWVATGLSDGRIRLWGLRGDDFAMRPVLLEGHRNGVYGLEFSSDDMRLRSWANDGTARIWPLNSEAYVDLAPRRGAKPPLGRVEAELPHPGVPQDLRGPAG